MEKKRVKEMSNSPKKLTNREIQLATIENFISLQRVLTNLTIKFDALSGNISRLLEIFENAARGYISKTTPEKEQEDKDLIRKLDSLLDQNKVIAKGLTLIEDKIRHKVYSEHAGSEQNQLRLQGTSSA